ncbi:siphovirus ReqiPepy6 Gp37-like family protein [Nocardiopsis sp. LOL_012]|uniref:siphovirus ReqiPepy6 Gp37-like family protein n=1 Tax=Nocardiopsis sp. LOL_012 TaxID=3345409 RepID=UPI003A881FB6
MDEWVLRVRDANRNMIGEIDDEQELEIRDRHLGHGAWKLVMDSGTESAALLEEGHGIVFETGGRTVFSGPTTRFVAETTTDNAGTNRPEGAETVTATGISDTSAFRRIIYPDPTTAVTTTGVKHPNDRVTLTGPAETVIGHLIDQHAGPAALPERQHPGLIIPTSQGRGLTITSAERFTDLHETAFSLAAGAGLGWRVLQHGADLSFGVYEPRDLTNQMGFSVELGNVASYTYQLTPPEVTHLIIGAGGEGADRLLFEFAQPSPLWPGLHIEEFKDSRNLKQTPDSEEDDDWVDPAVAAAQQAQERFAEAAATQTVAFDLLPVEGLVWGTDVDLGDRVNFTTPRGAVTDLIREVVYQRTPTGGQTITPIVGDSVHMPRTYRALRRLRRDVDRLAAT